MSTAPRRVAKTLPRAFCCAEEGPGVEFVPLLDEAHERLELGVEGERHGKATSWAETAHRKTRPSQIGRVDSRAVCLLSRQRFAKRLAPGAKLLDVGSGSGRDARAFLDAGFDVHMLDPSAGLAEHAARYVQEKYPDRYVRVLRAEELQDVETFDAIWSCASFVHMTLKEAQRSMLALMRALKPDGYFFLSVQEGDSVDHLYDGRL